MSGFVNVTPDSNNVVADALDGEAVIINLLTGVYYSTEGVGGWIWQNIVAGVAIDVIVAVLSDLPHDADIDVAADVRHFLDELTAEQLVVASGTAGGTEPVGERPTRYTSAKLSVYRDMTDLMALDPPMPMLDGADR